MMKFWDLYAIAYDYLRLLRPYQFQVQRIRELAGISKGGLFLDLGCGTGYLIGSQKNVVGIDLSLSMVKVAQRKKRGLKYIVGDLNDDLPFRSSSFDGVVSNNAIAYLKNPHHLFQEISRILKPNGKITFATLRKDFRAIKVLKDHFKGGAPWWQLVMYLFVIVFILVLNLPIERKLSKGIYHGFDDNEISEALHNCGFKIVNIEKSYGDQAVLVHALKI